MLSLCTTTTTCSSVSPVMMNELQKLTVMLLVVIGLSIRNTMNVIHRGTITWPVDDWVGGCYEGLTATRQILVLACPQWCLSLSFGCCVLASGLLSQNSPCRGNCGLLLVIKRSRVGFHASILFFRHTCSFAAPHSMGLVGVETLSYWDWKPYQFSCFFSSFPSI